MSETNEQTVLDVATTGEAQRTSTLSEAQWVVIDLCVRCANALGVKRSIGEIFGFVFCSPRAVSFEDVSRVLNLSAGTTSHGLRFLKRFGAIQTCYLARDRRDYYVAETSLWKLTSIFFSENLFIHLGGADERLRNSRETLLSGTASERELAGRIDLLIGWSRQIRRAAAAAADAIE